MDKGDRTDRSTSLSKKSGNSKNSKNLHVMHTPLNDDVGFEQFTYNKSSKSTADKGQSRAK